MLCYVKLRYACMCMYIMYAMVGYGPVMFRFMFDVMSCVAVYVYYAMFGYVLPLHILCLRVCYVMLSLCYAMLCYVMLVSVYTLCMLWSAML